MFETRGRRLPATLDGARFLMLAETAIGDDPSLPPTRIIAVLNGI